MPTNQIIVNGTFAQGSLGWSGTDIETNYPESAYLGNGSPNAVSEIDGNRNQTTVMQQSIRVGSSFTTELNFRTALRTASQANAGIEGFRIEIVDAQGNVIAGRTVLPTSQAWTGVTLPVTFPAAGTYLVRFTEVGPDDSLGAIVDDISLLVCFAEGTLIDTAKGSRPVGELAPEDLVWTLDGGLQPVRWIGRRHVTAAEMAADATLRPVCFAPGSLGPELPARPLLVSPQHRVCVGNWKTHLYFDAGQVLVPAVALMDGTSVRQVLPEAGVTYVHFLLDAHHIVRSEGALTESFLPTLCSVSAVEEGARRELLRLFPTLGTLCRAYPGTARPVLRRHEARLVA